MLSFSDGHFLLFCVSLRILGYAVTTRLLGGVISPAEWNQIVCGSAFANNHGASPSGNVSFLPSVRRLVVMVSANPQLSEESDPSNHPHSILTVRASKIAPNQILKSKSSLLCLHAATLPPFVHDLLCFRASAHIHTSSASTHCPLPIAIVLVNATPNTSNLHCTVSVTCCPPPSNVVWERTTKQKRNQFVAHFTNHNAAWSSAILTPTYKAANSYPLHRCPLTANADPQQTIGC